MLKKYWRHFHSRDRIVGAGCRDFKDTPSIPICKHIQVCSMSNVDCKTSSHFALGADVSRQEVLKTRGMSISRRLRVKLKLLLKLFRRRINPYLRSTTTTKVRFDSFHNFKFRLIYQVNSMQAFEIQFIQVK